MDGNHSYKKRDETKRKHKSISPRKSDSEFNDNLKRNQIESLPIQLNKKRKKRKREDISDSDNSQTSKYLFDETKSKQKKRKLSNSLSETCAPTCNTDRNRHSLKKDLQIIKREVSDESSDNSEVEMNGNGALVYKKNIAIKNEVQSGSEYDSADSTIFQTSEFQNQVSAKKSPSVTILQDVRLIPKTPEEKLKKMYPGLEQIEPNAELKISDSDEVHLFKIPKNINLDLLKNVDIDLHNQCKITLGGRYTVTPTIKVPHPQLILSKNTKILRFKHDIKMDRCIKSDVESYVTVSERNEVVLVPDHLTKQHPLFGFDFRQKVVLSDDVGKQLGDALVENILSKGKKLRKKKHKTNIKTRNEEPDQEILKLFQLNIKKEASDDSAFGSSCSVDKVKRRKKEKRRVSETNTNEELEISVEKIKHNRTKKKKKIEDDHWLDVSNIKQEVHEVDGIKRERSVINSTLMPDILRTPKFSPEVSTIVAEPCSSGKRSKKLKKEVSVKKEKIISDLLNDISSEIHFKHVKTEF